MKNNRDANNSRAPEKNALTRDLFAPLLSALVIIGALFLASCSKTEEVNTPPPEPVVIHNGEECDLCGMYINRFPGPKAQVFERGAEQSPVMKKFCSTRDMFAYALQPEHQHRVQHIYVHDVASAPWDSQEKAIFIDARTATYVIGHRLRGAMGPALASFALEKEAQQFANEFGGRLVRFSEIDNELLNNMSASGQLHSHSH